MENSKGGGEVDARGEGMHSPAACFLRARPSPAGRRTSFVRLLLGKLPESLLAATDECGAVGVGLKLTDILTWPSIPVGRKVSKSFSEQSKAKTSSEGCRFRRGTPLSGSFSLSSHCFSAFRPPWIHRSRKLKPFAEQERGVSRKIGVALPSFIHPAKQYMANHGREPNKNAYTDII